MKEDLRLALGSTVEPVHAPLLSLSDLNHLKECLRLEVISRDGKKPFSWGKALHRCITSPTRRFYFWWRIASWLHHNKTGYWKKKARKINQRLCLRYGIDIALDARIGAGMKINHGYGIVIRPECVIGKNLNIRHGVTIGRKTNGDCNGLTVIGDNVDIGAQVCIIGDVKIGNDVMIGAASFINKDIPDDTLAYNAKETRFVMRTPSAPAEVMQ
ncbi:serine acetyltransferase [Mixta theicola]|uniref:Serine acetyltransferase n=1 Tax=Mixta theicola TaxID=1458355 RepID=A0A2K1QBJ9_9GAMM|nr:serine acetyltransferase [Mixta theicola]PNS12402.1 serine acetyltransferase [Mixta theicola]GLR08163.1 putative colanic acid biosynthesis acetyltransferase wcaB [Mixta theicola]